MTRCLAAAALAAVLLAGCDGGGGGEAPIGDSVYVEVLVDLALAQGRAEMFGDLPDAVVDSVLTAHGLDYATYERAAEFYAEHPDDYLSRLQEAIDRTNEEKRPRLGRF
jgi:hypothetical protein